jgi:hypothetical protein
VIPYTSFCCLNNDLLLLLLLLLLQIGEGAWQGWEALQEGVVGGLRAVTLDPLNAFQRDGTWVIIVSEIHDSRITFIMLEFCRD